MVIPEVKAKYIKETEEKIEKIIKQYKRGLISNEERYNSVIAAWTEASEKITQALINNLDRFNPVYMMSQSGARGNINQIKQLAGMRGLMADTQVKLLKFL